MLSTAETARLAGAWDCREAAWWHRRESKTAWLAAHGLPGHLYRAEFWDSPGGPFARVFAYHLNAAGRRHWNEPHETAAGAPHDHSACAPAVIPPRDVPLPALPPADLLAAA